MVLSSFSRHPSLARTAPVVNICATMMWKTLIVAFMAAAVLGQEIDLGAREQYKQMLEAQCKKNGAEDKVQDVENAGRQFIECLKGLFDFNTLKDEIERAKPNGELDEVFKKYCAKAPQLKTCINGLLEGVKPCVDSVAVEHYDPLKNSTDQLIDFVCHKDGERIAVFIAYEGRECLRNSTEDIKKCADDMRKSFPTLNSVKEMSLPNKCGKFDDLTTCVVAALEKCNNPTPANMAESLLRFVRKGSLCESALPLNKD